MALTESWLKANNGKPVPAVAVKTDRDGLSVRISKKGKLTFQLRYRFNRKQDRVDLGSYPRLSLKEAREKAHSVLARLEQGHNPKITLAVEKIELQSIKSFRDIFYDWHEDYCVTHNVGHFEIKRSFEIYILPKMGGVPIEDLTPLQWIKTLKEISKKVPAIADRLLTNAKLIYKWCVKRGIVSHNPLSDFTAKDDLGVQSNEATRVLSDTELVHLFTALGHCRMSPKNKAFFYFCLHFGCRNGELRKAKQEDFDFDEGVWTIPAENHKTGKKSKKPLFRPIIPEIKDDLRAAFSFSNSRIWAFTNTNNDEKMSHSSPLPLPYNLMQWLRRHRKYQMEHWSMHDLRRTARTNFSTMGEPHIAEIMLGHVMPGQWRVYDQHRYLEEQALVYRKWWEKVEGLKAAAI